MALADIAAVVAAVGVAVLVSRIAFSATGSGAVAYNAIAGLIGKSIWGLAALFLILGGISGDGISGMAIFGIVILTIVLFLARGHAAVLREEDIRAKIGGQ